MVYSAPTQADVSRSPPTTAAPQLEERTERLCPSACKQNACARGGRLNELAGHFRAAVRTSHPWRILPRTTTERLTTTTTTSTPRLTVTATEAPVWRSSTLTWEISLRDRDCVSSLRVGAQDRLPTPPIPARRPTAYGYLQQSHYENLDLYHEEVEVRRVVHPFLAGEVFELESL